MEPTPEQQKSWDDWKAAQPPHVQEMANRFDPWTLFRLKNGPRVYVMGYDVDKETQAVSLIVDIDARFNCVVLEHLLSGVPPEDLTECELPGPDERVGTLGDMIDAGIAAEEGKVN